MPKDRPDLDELLKRIEELTKDPEFWRSLTEKLNEVKQHEEATMAKARPQHKLLRDLDPRPRPPKFRQARLCRA